MSTSGPQAQAGIAFAKFAAGNYREFDRLASVLIDKGVGGREILLIGLVSTLHTAGQSQAEIFCKYLSQQFAPAPGGAWEITLMRLTIGQFDLAQAFARANNDQERSRAYFYAACRCEFVGEMDAAKELFTQCVAKQVDSDSQSFEQILASQIISLGIARPEGPPNGLERHLRNIEKALIRANRIVQLKPDLTFAEVESSVKLSLTLPTNHPLRIRSHRTFGDLCRKREYLEKAKNAYEDAFACFESSTDGEPLDRAMILHKYAEMCLATDEPRIASNHFHEAAKVREKVNGIVHPDTRESIRFLIDSLSLIGKYAAAERSAKYLLKAQQNLHGNDHHEVALVYEQLAKLYQHQGLYNKARVAYERSLTVYRRLYGDDHLTVASVLKEIADPLQRLGKYETAENYLKRAIHICGDNPKLAKDKDQIVARLRSLRAELAIAKSTSFQGEEKLASDAIDEVAPHSQHAEDIHDSTDTKERVMRVFISSTFLDMEEERNHLMKFVFPQLRKRCLDRGVIWNQVDLRWGITDERAAEEGVLPVCLREIDRCRPFFIGLLGERYGWVPDAIPEELLEHEPWLNGFRDRSITEIEIAHGVLEKIQADMNAMFYFRDPGFIDSLPTSEQATYRDADSTSVTKLAELKDRIRSNDYSIREDYPNPKVLGQWVLADLTAFIDKIFPESRAIDMLERDTKDQEAFIRYLSQSHVPRQEYFDLIDRHIESNEPPLTIIGEAGFGKTSLLANWTRDRRHRDKKSLILFHSTDANSRATDPDSMLRRFLFELQRRFGIVEPIPTSSDDLRIAFSEWLQKVDSKTRVVFVVDGLETLGNPSESGKLSWLPANVVKNVRFVFSAEPGTALEEIKRNGWQTERLSCLTGDERSDFIAEYLRQHSKALSTEQLERLKSTSQTAIPLYTKILLDELCVTGNREQLSEIIDDYLSAQNVSELFAKVLTRFETDYNEGRENLIKDSLSLLWASRSGLAETELLALLGQDPEPLPQAIWSPVRMAFGESLIEHDGLIRLAHAPIRDAIESRYISNDAVRKDMHKHLADYFESQEMSERKLDELPWQLSEVHDWGRLSTCVSDLSVLRKLAKGERKYELLGYWRQLANTRDVSSMYVSILQAAEESTNDLLGVADIYNEVAGLFKDFGSVDNAEALFRRAIEIRESNDAAAHDPKIAVYRNNLALLLKSQDRLEESKELLKLSVKSMRELFGEKDLKYIRCLTNLASVLAGRNELAESETYSGMAVKAIEAAQGPNSSNLVGPLHNHGRLLIKLGRSAEAGETLQRALTIARRTHGSEHPTIGVIEGDVAEVIQNSTNPRDAEPYLTHALSVAEKNYGPNSPQVAKALNNLAAALNAQGKTKKAEPLLRRAVEICESSHGTPHTDAAKSISNLAVMLLQKNRLDEAEQMFHRALEIHEKILGPDHPDIAIACHNLGEIMRRKGRFTEAEPYVRRALKISEASMNPKHPSLGRELNSLGVLLAEIGKHSEAEQHLRRALSIAESSPGQNYPNLIQALNNLGSVLRIERKFDEAENILRRANELQKQHSDPNGSEFAMNLQNLAHVLVEAGKAAEAVKLYQQAIEINKSIHGENHPSVATLKAELSAAQIKSGDVEAAGDAIKDVLTLALNKGLLKGGQAVNMGDLIRKLNEGQK